ncbi:Dimethylaniline monooxygenase [N-oxide-forming] [Meloidogyne graminicola]|uniref:Flavin-containing monooxygenase n=1 Tax=Meloidogyne graminicola TaxID=189291 RepID=A0A8S9ZV23_9BILA|nr:Dimethylaniline monooxygenase [N-oxide-forming] [Meloidogyne graminicola]
MKVCVIGAGVSGLPSIKACLEQNFQVDCYEKTSNIGGLWNYRPNEPGVGANVMASTVVNTSKEMMSYSDFPPPPEWPNFMHHSYVQKYLEMYAEHFDLIKYIHFNTEVLEVKKDYLNNTQWSVKLSNGKTKLYSFVFICTGHHCEPCIPTFNGLNIFKGKVLHSKHYHDYRGFENKNVMLVGIGNSALDVAVELAGIAKNVIISTRRGTWLFNRIAQRGLPYDVVYQSRFYDWLMRKLPWSIANDFHEWRMQQKTDHDLYGLRPEHRFFQQHPAVNDALTNLLASGRVKITDDIDYIEEYSVHTKDGRYYSIDVIILCTGYTFGFPFLNPKELIPVKKNIVELYRFILPPSSSAYGLAIIGLVQPIGSVSPIAEMQARWVALIFAKGINSLPSEKEMRVEIASRREKMRRQYFESEKHRIQVQYLPYMDELAEQIGCSPPKINNLLWNDPSFALSLLFGPNVPYIYRLKGPNSWSNARKAIIGVSDRVKSPLKQRNQTNTKVINKYKRKGLMDGIFVYSITKSLALYLTIIFVIGAWLFSRQELAFVIHSIAISFVAILAFIFYFDISWI